MKRETLELLIGEILERKPQHIAHKLAEYNWKLETELLKSLNIKEKTKKKKLKKNKTLAGCQFS